MTTLEEYQVLLNKHDWYWQMADEIEETEKGYRESVKLQEIAKESPEHNQAYQTILKLKYPKMKKLIILVLMLISLTTYAKKDDGGPIQPQTVVVHDTVSPEFQKANDYVDGVITGLSKHLKVPAEHVYQVVTDQQKLQSYTYLLIDAVIFIVLLIFAYRVFIFYRRIRNEKDPWYNDDWNDHDGQTIYFVGMFVMIIVFLVVFGNTFSIILTGFYNPEYGAISDIAHFVK